MTKGSMVSLSTVVSRSFCQQIKTTNLLGPLGQTSVASSGIGVHARRPELLLAVGRDPQLVACKSAASRVTTAGQGVHGRAGIGHQLPCHRATYNDMSHIGNGNRS